MPTLAQTHHRLSGHIPPQALSYIIGEDNYVHIYFVDGSKATFGKTLKLLHTKYPSLIRISKSMLTSPLSITDWERSGATQLRVTVAGTDYLVPRHRVNEVMTRLLETVYMSVADIEDFITYRHPSQ